MLRSLTNGLAAAGMAALLAGCAGTMPALTLAPAPHPMGAPAVEAAAEPRGPAAPGALDGLIAHYAELYDVPESLIRRVIVRESGYNPRARNGPYWGLMQIRHDTARSMGYRGTAQGLLDADTNLRYGVKYLAGAYVVGGRNADQAVRNYSRGYYYKAKAKGLLGAVGLR